MNQEHVIRSHLLPSCRILQQFAQTKSPSLDTFQRNLFAGMENFKINKLIIKVINTYFISQNSVLSLIQGF